MTIDSKEKLEAHIKIEDEKKLRELEKTIENYSRVSMATPFVFIAFFVALNLISPTILQHSVTFSDLILLVGILMAGSETANYKKLATLKKLFELKLKARSQN